MIIKVKIWVFPLSESFMSTETFTECPQISAEQMLQKRVTFVTILTWIKMDKHIFKLRRVAKKPVLWVSDQVLYEPDCTAIEDGKKLENSDLRSRPIVQSM